MTEQPLSPAALAVLDAMSEWFVVDDDERQALSAALRAAADQLFADWDGMCCAEHLRAIAAELEGQ